MAGEKLSFISGPDEAQDSDISYRTSARQATLPPPPPAQPYDCPLGAAQRHCGNVGLILPSWPPERLGLHSRTRVKSPDFSGPPLSGNQMNTFKRRLAVP